MYIEELIPKINLEDYNNEFKGIIGEKNSNDFGWLKTIAAFANTCGGNLYIGVDNRTHKVLSLDHRTVDQLSLLINQRVRERITPAIKYSIQPIPADNTVPTRYVLVVKVELSGQLPVYVHENGLMGIYVRSFGQTVLATPEQIRDMVLMSENVPFDKPFSTEDYKRSDFSAVFSYAQEHNVAITEKALISCGFMSAEKKLSRGALLFRDDCSSMITKITATLWPGVSKGDSVVLASEDFIGNLLKGVQFATNFIRSHSINGFVKQSDSRTDLFSYPERSVLEGVVNAIGHRNYFISGSQIEINMFRDRLEITSPGALLGVKLMKKETDIASIIPRRRNEVICGTFQLLHLMEEKGSGFDKIEEDYSHYDSKYAPYVSSASDSFTLTLPSLTWHGTLLDENASTPVRTDTVLHGKNDLAILSYCYGKARSVTEIAAHLGIKPSTYLRKKVILPLVENGYLLAYGEDRSITYKSNPENVFPEI